MRTRLILLSSLILSVLAGAGMSAEDPSLRGWWKLDDGAGNTAVDSSDRANDGAIFNLAGGLGQGGSVWDFDAERGIVASFSGDDSGGAYISAGTVPALDLESEFTWVFWARQHVDQPNEVPGSGNDVMLGNRYGGTESPLQFVKFTATNFEYYNEDPDYAMTINYEDLPGGQWVHHVGVKNGATLTYYRDGVEAGTATLTKTMDQNPFFMGGDAGGERWRGWLSDVRLYERALSADEIKTLAETPAAPVIRAWSPDPADGALDVTMPLLRWKSPAVGLLHDVYFGTTPELTEADLAASRLFAAVHYYSAGIEPGAIYYWRVDEVDGTGTVFPGNVWSFTAMPLTAHFPEPADGVQNVLLTPTLSWTAGQLAMEHHVYFGADRSAVEAGAAETDKGSLGTNETTYQIADVLEADTTYYWRVDETASAQINTGPVWNFTTVSGGPGGAIREWWSGIGGADISSLTGSASFPDNPSGREFVSSMEGPVNWSDNYGTRLSGWLYPPETGDYTFWISGDNNCELWLSTDADPANTQLIATVTDWTESREWNKEANQQSPAVNLAAGQRYYIEALMKEETGGDNIAVAWQGPGFSTTVIGADGVGPTPLLPVRAYSPYPANRAADTLQDLVLTWKPGERALQHEVYFGDDAEAIAAADTSSPLFMNRQNGTSYDVGELEWGKTFYWRVDEINEGDPESPWVGHVWSFSTADFIGVDDFESYTDNIEAGEAIWQTWVDGLTNLTGSVVGYFEAPFAEQTIVHGGGQSMPLDYNNINSPYYSEAELDLAPAQDWTIAGLTDLTLYVRGQTSNDPDTLYVVVQDSSNKAAVAINPDPAVANATAWSQWKVPLTDLAGVNLTKVKKISIGVGDRDNPIPDGTGVIFVDDIRVTKPEPAE